MTFRHVRDLSWHHRPGKRILHTLHPKPLAHLSIYSTSMKLVDSLISVVLLASASLRTVAAASSFVTAAPRRALSRIAAKSPVETPKLSNALRTIHRGGGARGGNRKQPAPTETNQEIAVKTTVLAALEAAGLLGVIAGSQVLAPTVNNWMDKLNLPSSINGLAVIQWIALVFVTFSSNTMKSWVQGGMSTATKQSLQPNVVPGDPEWYANLKKPWFNPPGWVFPIMWLIVSKPTQLIAASKIIKSDVSTKYWPVLAVYCTHLSLGDAWNEVFFGNQRIGLGAVVICTFFGLLLASTALFWGIDETAGKFLLPTCVWVFVATSLNLSIYYQNK